MIRTAAQQKVFQDLVARAGPQRKKKEWAADQDRAAERVRHRQRERRPPFPQTQEHFPYLSRDVVNQKIPWLYQGSFRTPGILE